MLTFLWCLAAIALVLASAAWVKTRQLIRELRRLSESHTQLRYELGQLALRLEADPVKTDMAEVANEPGRSTSFVPLSSLKKPR